MRELIDNITDEELLSYCIRISYDVFPKHIDAISFTWGSWYQIVISSTISKERQKAAALHELEHICKNDFDRFDPVEIIEEENEF